MLRVFFYFWYFLEYIKILYYKLNYIIKFKVKGENCICILMLNFVGKYFFFECKFFL